MSQPPLFDIVMLVHQGQWCDLAIRAVEYNTKNPYRLILVAMAPTQPETIAILKGARERGHTVLWLSENRSFSNGVNAGVRAGFAPNIVVLNDDAMVTEGWDGHLLQDLAVKGVGMVGARSNYASGAQGDAGFTGDAPYLVFVCVAIRRKTWETIGPLDEETFDGFSTEDIDYSWRVRHAGYALRVSKAFVLHAGSQTLGTLVGEDPARMQQYNMRYNARLIDKWGGILGLNPDQARRWAASNSKLRENVLVMSFHAEEWTRVRFLGAFTTLKRSDNHHFTFDNLTRLPIHHARQHACDFAYSAGFDALLMLDDDATFPPELIRRLLEHGKDVVCALAYQRKPPHSACAFEMDPEGKLSGGPLEGIEETGLRKVDVSGLHVSLVRMSVIRRLKDAKIEQYFGGFDNKLGEDFAFCLNLKKIGVPVYVDTDIDCGHLGSGIEVNRQYKRQYAAQQAMAAAQADHSRLVV